MVTMCQKVYWKRKKINRNEHFLMNERYLTYRMLIRIWPCDKERSLDHIYFPWGLLQCDGYNISLYDTLYHFADFETSCYRVAFKMRVQRTQNNWNQWFSASVLQSLIVNVLTWNLWSGTNKEEMYTCITCNSNHSLDYFTPVWSTIFKQYTCLLYCDLYFFSINYVFMILFCDFPSFLFYTILHLFFYGFNYIPFLE